MVPVPRVPHRVPRDPTRMTRTQSSCVRVVCVNVEAALSQCIPCSHVRGFGVHWRASAGVANRCAGHNIDIRAQDPRNRRVRSKSERHATRRTSRGSSRVKFTGCPGASQTAATVVKAAEIFSPSIQPTWRQDPHVECPRRRVSTMVMWFRVPARMLVPNRRIAAPAGRQ